MAASGAQAKTVAVASPDGKVRAVLSDDGGKLQYRVTIDGRAILDPSPLAMKVDGVDLGNAAQIGTVQRKVVNSRYRFLGGKAEAIDKANVASVALTARGIRFEADVHVADDGVGVRLRLPAKAGRQVEADHSGWKLAAADPRVWAAALDPSYEAVYETKTLGQLTGRALGMPLTTSLE